MSFKQPNQYGQGMMYRENLSFQQQIQKQMLSVMQSINEDQPRYIRSAIKGFLLLVTPEIIDEIYKKNIEAIDKEWQIEYEKHKNIYNESTQNALCPDVEDEPEKNLSLELMIDKYVETQSLFERKGLLLELKSEETL